MTDREMADPSSDGAEVFGNTFHGPTAFQAGDHNTQNIQHTHHHTALTPPPSPSTPPPTNSLA